jgi:hypothetical protein
LAAVAAGRPWRRRLVLRVISSAFIINKFPESVLTSTINIENDVREVKDDSIEAAMCYVTAKTIAKAMYKFILVLISYLLIK